jgi:beta-galactosidase
MMMLCETRQMASTPEGLSQLEIMIRRYRNSPAIILWSVGNEEWPLQSQPAGTPVVAHMVERAHMVDPTRLCTAASTAPFDNNVTRSLDVQGFNYTLRDIDAFHAKYPHKPCIGTETASTLCTRGIYETDKLRNWVSAYDVNHADWSELAEEWWKFYAAREWLAGGFAWTGFDYRGEPTPYGWPSINSQFGIVDVCGFPKDNFFYYKAWWSGEPVLHLLPHWNWQQRLGEEISVWVHANVEEVELFLNGQSQGRRKVEPLTHLEWKVPYQPGVLQARGMRNGAVLLTAKRETTGSSHAIRLSADRTEINADDEDIAILKVEVLDEQGRLVPTASDLISFRIEGNGTLLGVGNGDPNCQQSDVEPRRSVFNGLAQVIVQSSMKAGSISVEAYTENWPGPRLVPATLTIRTLTAEPRAAL